MADNFHVTVKAPMGFLGRAIEMALKDNYNKVIGYKILNDENKIPTLILFWSDSSGVINFPTSLNFNQLEPIVLSWIESIQFEKIIKKPDIDGDVKKGFSLTTGNEWNFIEHISWNACLKIQPAWMLYGK